MAITINGSSNTITGLAAGGLPDGSIQAADLATGVGGKILQRQYVNANTSQQLDTTSWTDVTGMTKAFTPISASSKIMIYGNLSCYVKGTTSGYHGIMEWKIQKDGSDLSGGWKIMGGYGSPDTATIHSTSAAFYHISDASNTTARTYKLVAQNQETTNSVAYLSNIGTGGHWMIIDEYST